MKQRIGGILLAALGVAVIGSGLSSAPATAVGGVTPCANNIKGVDCPTGTITFNESDKVVHGSVPSAPPGADARSAAAPAGAAGDPNPPSSWTVTVSPLNCALPDGSDAETISLPDKGHATSGQLYIYSDDGHATMCQYAYAETPVAGWTATYNPDPPQTIPYDAPDAAQARTASTNGNLAVAVLNTAYVAPKPSPSPTVTPSHKPSPKPTASTTHSAGAPETSTSGSSPAAAAATSSTAAGAATLPDTGAGHTDLTLAVGSLLVLLGVGLVLAGRSRRQTG
jgi:LPXTG-motif cell wall-anchored protein